MKTISFAVVLALALLWTHATYSGSLYEEAQDMCTDGKEHFVVFTHDAKTDISVYKKDGSLDWSRKKFNDIVSRYDKLFVVRCTRDDSPVGAIPLAFVPGATDDLGRVIEMEYLANSIAQERGKYTYTFHGIANFTKELFVFFGLHGDVLRNLLKHYGDINKDERAIERFSYQTKHGYERKLNIYPPAISDIVDRVYFHYQSFLFEYVQTSCSRSSSQDSFVVCEPMGAYDFGVKFLKSPANIFVYLDVYNSGDIPLKLYFFSGG